MSKQRNTLFNYFTSPPGSANKKPAVHPSPVSSEKPTSSAKKVRLAEQVTPTSTKKSKISTSEKKIEGDDDVNKENNGSESEQTKSPPKKRRRILVLDSDDSEDEWKADKNEVESDDDNDATDESSGEPSAESEEETPKRKKKQPKKATIKGNVSQFKISATESPSSTVSPATKLKLAQLSAPQPKDDSATADQTFSHHKYEFLKADKLRDLRKKKKSEPDFDSKTLHVPLDFLQGCTPAMRQWWEMKSQHFDTVLFFKVGKFYELYHMDAEVGVTELGLTFMRGDNAHSGFPEIAYGRFSASLIQKGYKVARVEQTENPEMMAERLRLSTSKTTKFDKVVKREICQITTKGTQTFSVIDGAAHGTESNYLLSLTEKTFGSNTTYGVCFIDTSIGTFHLGQFEDDRHSSCLRTMLAHHPPVQILYERGAVSEATLKLLNSACGSALKDALASSTEFWTSEKTLKNLAEGDYFTSNPTSSCKFPLGLKQFLSEGDSLGLTAKDNSELAISALGACVWYLKDCKLEQQLLAMERFDIYHPIDSLNHEIPETSDITGRHMILDSITLSNLDILYYNNENKKGTLLNRLDSTCSPFGKRLLRHWICVPLCDISGINARQEAIKDLLDHPHLMEEARTLLKQLPDLERLLSRIHTQANARHSETHPDSRAIFYEDKIYSQKKIKDFLMTLKGFKTAIQIANCFQAEESNLNSNLLTRCMCITGKSTNGKFPNMSGSLSFFETAFDHEKAEKEGQIIPQHGVDSEYDDVMAKLHELKKRLDSYLEEQKRFFGVKVVYFGTAKNRFQLEVSDNAAKKANSKYELQSQRKGFKRYWTPETKELLAEQLAAEDQKSNVLKDLRRRIFAQFTAKHEEWNTAINCLAELDVLMSLAEYSRSEEGETCVPEFVNASKDKPFVQVREGRHPCITVDGFVPNDTVIGCEDSAASLLLLTGPNMGGKSTLMRQLGLIVIMAHVGCHVPATSCRLSPVDRIFTRLGANDDIMAGESTFFVELSETSAILRHASRHSLVLVDELGRGTSTYDGTAIAAAVVDQLVKMTCRTIFSTHYHTLVEDFKNFAEVALIHMACMVENDNEDDPTAETVTFLYKLANGACPKSYGFNAARLAGIPSDIIKKGHNKAIALENEISRRKLFQSVWTCQDPSDLARMFTRVSIA